MMLRLFALSIALLFTSLPAANAATYRIEGFQNVVEHGFGSTLFHEATGCNGMCGATVDRATGTGHGIWDSTTGHISFVMDLVGHGTATALGQLNLTDRHNGGAVGISGFMNIVIEGSLFGKDGVYDFTFLDRGFVSSVNPVANWFNDGILGLWGGAAGSQYNGGALGVDFRIEVAPIPLPAGVLLLLSCLGGFALLRRRQIAAA